ncbi:FKBP-type peptidyl-prolyl cis-trans isomerase [Pseudactinotalea sp.]|uniref:FKBP-type peptidyl-prolyl cis-trans isomerase n=1 Tax=Pseudactinotalea sp. TaxID=1926260 RepID=UPI003B3A12F6
MGDAPVFTWPDACAPEGLQVEVLSEGDGREVVSGAAVLANYAGFVWGSDEPFDSSYDRGSPSLFSLEQVVAGWSQGIPGSTAGSRLLISIPPDLGYGPQGGNEAAGIGPTDTIVFVVDVVDTYDAASAGQADATPLEASDLPVSLEGDLGAAATLSIDADAPEPTEPAVYRVADGTGEPVAVGQTVAVNYTVSFWDGTSLETSWSPGHGEDQAADEAESAAAGPLLAPLGQGTIFDLLEGVPVGSRVVLVAPAADGSPAIGLVADVLGAG